MNEPPAFLSRKGRLCVCCCHGDESTASDSFDHHLLWKKFSFFLWKSESLENRCSTVWEVFEKLFSKEVYIVRGFCVSSLEALLEQLNFYSGK